MAPISCQAVIRSDVPENSRAKFLVARTVSFRDRGNWRLNVDVVDEWGWIQDRERRFPPRWLALAYGLKLLWLSRRFDAVAVGRFGLWLPVLQRLLGIKRPVVITDVEWWGRTTGWGLMNRWAGNAASFLCGFSRVEIERYSRYFKIPHEKFRVVPMAFQQTDLDGCSVTDGGYIFAGGNQGRDWKTFLRAVEGTDYPVRLLTHIAGTDSVPPNVTIGAASRLGYNAEIAAASCVVVPLLPQPLRITGITTWVNAMAMGKVVIVTDPDATADYIEDGVSGFSVPPGDYEGLRRCITRVMEDAQLRRQVGAAAKERAWREFSPEVFRRRVLALLAEACQGERT